MNKKLMGGAFLLVSAVALLRGRKGTIRTGSGTADQDDGPVAPVADKRFSEAMSNAGLSSAQADRATAFHTQWDIDGVPLLMQLALIANAIEESRLTLCVRSAVGLADDKKGGSWTAFQILLPSVELAAQKLGLALRSVLPDREPTGGDLVRFARNQARIAVVVAVDPQLLRFQWDSGQVELSAFDLFTRWAAGPAWPGKKVLATDTAQAVLGGRLPDENHLSDAVAELRARGATIAPGALEKLSHFRKLRNSIQG
jgi:hypothetical protein